MTRIAFLGAGNMASAMAEGLLARGLVRATDLACLGGSGTSAARLAARIGARLARDPANLCAEADVVVVAFKPQHLATADPRLAEATAGRLVLSLLAGRRLETLATVFPRARLLVRAMPNTPARVGAGVTGWCAATPPSPADRALVEQLLGALGAAHEVPEAWMDAITAVGGSGPGFVFEFAAALREGAVAAGLPPDLAAAFVQEVVAGAGRLLRESGLPAEELRRQVTSPNGTTAAGLAALEAGGFRAVVREAVLAATRRGGELARG